MAKEYSIQSEEKERLVPCGIGFFCLVISPLIFVLFANE